MLVKVINMEENNNLGIIGKARGRGLGAGKEALSIKIWIVRPVWLELLDV